MSFFTVLPVGEPAVGTDGALSGAARQVHLLPLVGLVAGLPGATVLLSAHLLPSGVAATLALGATLLVTGFHHADGVLDAGDALMVRGTPARRREVLKDARVGIGGIGSLFLVYAPALAALVTLAHAAPTRAALALLAAEAAHRAAMALTLTFGRPAEPGSSSAPFVRSLRGARRLVGLTLALTVTPLLALPLGMVAVPVALAAPVTAIFVLHVARRAFGGINGDVVGATGETTRTVALVILSATL